MFIILVFLDLKKTFNAVNHEVLVNKLGLYGMEQTFLNFLRSYPTDRNQMCSINRELSSPRIVKCGIPQPCKGHFWDHYQEWTTTTMFAEDTTLTASANASALNADLENVLIFINLIKI